MEIKVKAPAKINLYLNILNKRQDGYHNVNMIMQSVSLYDTVTVTQTNENRINISSNFDFSGEKTNNTAYIAAAEFFKCTGIKSSGININLEKKIPLCAGLAGGSTDAAGVLLALNSIFKTNLSRCDLANIGKKVGADVPFCIFGGTMISKGTGTLLSSLPYMPDCFIVLVKPKILISTQRAYAKSDEVTVPSVKSMSEIIYAVKVGSPRDFCYAIDQSNLTIDAFLSRTYDKDELIEEYKSVKYIGLWLYLKGKKKIHDQNNNIDVLQLDSIMFLNKLVDWANKVVSANDKPIVVINYYD